MKYLVILCAVVAIALAAPTEKESTTTETKSETKQEIKSESTSESTSASAVATSTEKSESKTSKSSLFFKFEIDEEEIIRELVKISVGFISSKIDSEDLDKLIVNGPTPTPSETKTETTPETTSETTPETESISAETMMEMLYTDDVRDLFLTEMENSPFT